MLVTSGRAWACRAGCGGHRRLAMTPRPPCPADIAFMDRSPRRVARHVEIDAPALALARASHIPNVENVLGLAGTTIASPQPVLDEIRQTTCASMRGIPCAAQNASASAKNTASSPNKSATDLPARFPVHVEQRELHRDRRDRRTAMPSTGGRSGHRHCSSSNERQPCLLLALAGERQVTDGGHGRSPPRRIHRRGCAATGCRARGCA